MGLEIRVKIIRGTPAIVGLPKDVSIDSISRSPEGLFYLMTCNSPDRAQLDIAMREIYSQIVEVDVLKGPTQQMEELSQKESALEELGYGQVPEDAYSLFIGCEREIMEQARIVYFNRLNNQCTFVSFCLDGRDGSLNYPSYFEKGKKTQVLFSGKQFELETIM